MRAIAHVLLIPILLVPSLIRGAAQAQQDQIQKELALALIPFGAAQGGEIIVGKLPPDLVASITLPPGARVLGSFVSLGYGQAVLTLPFGVDSARSFVQRQLLDHGWTAGGPMGMRMGGLQYAPRGSQPTYFCKSGTPGMLNITSQFYGRETLVRLTRNGDNTCDADVRAAGSMVATTSVALSAREANMPLTTLPPLWSPGDPMTSMRACRVVNSSGALPFQSQEQWLRTDLSAQAILDFLAEKRLV